MTLTSNGWGMQFNKSIFVYNGKRKMNDIIFCLALFCLIESLILAQDERWRHG